MLVIEFFDEYVLNVQGELEVPGAVFGATALTLV